MMEIRQNVDEACRLCLRGEGKISILEDDSNTGTVTAENIYDCVAVKITKDDKLPKGICEGCLQSVVSWCSFKSTCDETQKTFHQWLLCDGKSELLREESNCIPKADIKSSSCNTYKISSNGVEGRDVPAHPRLPLNFSNLENGDLPEIEGTVSPEKDKNISALPETSNSDSVESQSIPSDSIPLLEDTPSLDTSNSSQPKKSSLSVNFVNSNLSVHSVNIEPNNECIYEGSENTCVKSEIVLNASEKIDIYSNLKETLVNQSLTKDECPSLIVDKTHNNLTVNIDNDSVLKSQNIAASKENSIENIGVDGRSISNELPESQDKNEGELNIDDKCGESTSSCNFNIIENPSDDGQASSCEMQVDSEKENSTLNSGGVGGFSNVDDAKQSAYDVISTEGKGGDTSSLELKIVSTSTLDHTIFDDSPDIQSCNQSTVAPSMLDQGMTLKEAETSDDVNMEELSPQNKDHSISEQSSSLVKEGHGDDSGVALQEDLHGVSRVSPTKDDQQDESDDARSCTPISDIHEASSCSQEPNSTAQESQENITPRTENICATETSSSHPPITAMNIKLEPVDPPSESEDDPPVVNFQIRVKSEFSNLHSEEETNDYENMDTGIDRGLSSPTVNRNNGANTECQVCNRRYSTVNNYTKHLLTKIHLQNVKQAENAMQEGEQGEMPSRDSPMLRLRLSGDQLNTSTEEPSSIQSSPYLPNTSSFSRRKIEYCGLCNTSFGYISELKRHVQAKKHREYERVVKEAQPPEKIKTLTYGHALSDTRFIFLCPIEKCYFSSDTSEELLDHIKVHGIGESEEVKPEEEMSPTKPKLSVRQQELLRKEAEKRKLAEQQQRQQQQLQQQQFQHLQQQQFQHLQQQHFQQQKLQFLQKQKLQHQQRMRIQQQQQFRIQQQRMQQQQKRLQLQIQQQQLQYQMQFEQDIEEVNYSEDYTPRNYERDFECEACHKTFLKESGLRKHTYYCQALKSTEPSDENKLQEETQEMENDNQKLHCPLCDISFASKSVFVSHVQIYHKGSNLENGLFKINKKPPVMPVNNKLRIANKKGLGFVCNICGKKFSLLTSLNIHIKSHTVSIKHICRICKEGFTSRKAFMEHCRLHFLKPGSKETLCHKCFKVFKTRSELYFHRKNDMCSIKMKIFSCNSCEHSFKEASALEEHKVRFHSESIDMADDVPSIGELYDDSFIPMNPIALLQTPDENLPGPSSVTSLQNKNIQNYANPQSSNTGINFNISNSEDLNDNTNFGNVNQKTPFHCEICSTYYCSKQTLKKHIKKYHILNTPYIGSKRYTALKNSLQGGSLKLWKCKHCKTGFKTRKLLVLHLKKCQYNDLDLASGMCLQCGRWCESGKSRICRFCLPDFSKASKTMVKKSVELTKFQRPDFKDFQMYKSSVKQESNSSKYSGTSNDEIGLENSRSFFSDITSLSKHINNKTDRPPVRIKSERLDVPSSSTSIDPSFNIGNTQLPQNSIGRKPAIKGDNVWQTSDNTKLMKCPIGEKYFRNEMTMIKHYSQCDGSCENRCSRCRKLFHNPQDYEVHLVASTCFQPRKRSTSKMRYPSFGSKKKYSRQSVRFANNLALKAEPNIKPEMVPALNHINSTSGNSDTTDNFSDRTFDSSIYESCITEESGIYQDPSALFNSTNTVLEEKSRKLGRICRLCDKVITMQRSVYRHEYGCFKVFMHSQESVSCKKCCKTFSKNTSMKDTTAHMKQHVLDCHFIPYYAGEGIGEDGTRLNTPPPLLCYVCSFGFTDNISLQRHLKEHRYNKDDVNNIVLQLEDALISDERLASEESMFSLYVDLKNFDNMCTVKTGRKLSLQESTPGTRPFPVRKVFQCDKCTRSYTNRNKYLKHKKVHGIVKKSVLHEATANINEFLQSMSDVTSINNVT